jgi:hypothetical protein
MVRPADPTGSGLWGFCFLGVKNDDPRPFLCRRLYLYHALLKLKDDRVKWLDLELLCHRIIAPRTERIDKNP